MIITFSSGTTEYYFQLKIGNTEDMKILKPESTYVEKIELPFPQVR